MISVKTVVKDLGWQAIVRRVRALKKPYVKVGVLGSKKNSRPGEGITNVELALIQEFGSPKRHIPARSFIRAPFVAHRAEYRGMLRALLAGTLRKKGKEPVEALRIMGEKIAADMKKAAPGTPPPNAPAVYARKLRKGKGAGTPKTLVDTGRLVDSISYEVVK